MTAQEVAHCKSRLRDELYSIPGVEGVYTSFSDDILDIWVLIPDRDLDLVRQVSGVQQKLLQELPILANEELYLDIHVIYRAGRAAEELVPTGMH